MHSLTVSKNASALRPNGIYIDEIHVTDNQLSYNGLVYSNLTSTYIIPLYSHTISYKVHDCKTGIPLLNHTAINGDLIVIQQTISATSGVTGMFTIDVPQYRLNSSHSLQSVPFNATPSMLETLLETNYAIGNIEVTADGTCNNRTFYVKWLERGGDQDPLVVNGGGLIQEVGNNASVSVETVTDGGVFMRPLRADMLRIPKKSPQVCTYVCRSCDDYACMYVDT